MSENFGGDIISISDEDGKNYEFEHLDTIEMDGVYYLALLPVGEDGKTDDDAGIVILKSEKGDDGDDYLAIPDEEEEQRAYDRFMEELFADDDEE